MNKLTSLEAVVGITTVYLKTNSKLIANLFTYALAQNKASNNHRIHFEIFQDNYLSTEIKRLKNCKSITLNNKVVYTYDSTELICEFSLSGILRGIIDYNNKFVKVYYRDPLPHRFALHALILNPLSLLLPDNDFIFFHGASLAVKGRRFLILGNSGSGKSTLSFLLTQYNQKHKIKPVADDCCVVGFKKQSLYLFRIINGFGLSKNVIDKYKLNNSNNKILEETTKKTYLKSLPNQVHDDGILEAIIILENQNICNKEITITNLSRNKALIAFLDLTVSIPNPYIGKKLALLRKIASTAHALKICYQDKLDELVLRNIINDKINELGI